MLEAWIIEEIRRREEEERGEREQLRIEIEPTTDYPDCTQPAEEKVERGVCVIEL